MQTFTYSAALKLAAGLLLVIATLSAVAVADRVVAALWQWYKFAGYETEGVITLSRQTGGAFSFVCSAAALMSLIVRKVSISRQEGQAAKIAFCALILFCCSLFVYWALAMSPLNEWRA